MRILIPVIAALFVLACGSSENSETAAANGGTAGEIDFCSCVNEPLNTDARLKACGAMMNSLTPTESATKTMACREALPVPEGGPDLCFCLRTTSRDAELMSACEALIPDDMTPLQLTRKTVECAQ